ncbi:MAG: phosphodiester glycosidase family protein [Hyphomicrobiales bacterium]|nr:phosphodiester glycosidase family protein [Hyphomicrobiales bacterium]
MKKSQFIILIGVFVALVADNGRSVLANADSIPPRTLLVSKHLQNVPFEEVLPGIAAIKTIASNGTTLIALRIKPSFFRFGVTKQFDPKGNWVAEIGKEQNAQVAFNGGFFKISKKGHKVPVGLLMIEDIQFSSAWKKSGGYLIFRDGNISILQTAGNPVPQADLVLQSKPVLIEPGGTWAMNANQAIPKKRTLVCIDGEGNFIVVAIVEGGLSLFEAGWLMRGKEVGGFFNCDSAIAMDGGGSTQIWVKDRPDLSFRGGTTVQNAVTIQPR